MPSPFPGMDPYLEGSQWTSVHTALTVEIARQFAPRLPDRYVVRPNERVVTVLPDSDESVGISSASMYPDAYVSDVGPCISKSNGLVDEGGLAMLPPPLRMATATSERNRQVAVEIHDTTGGRLVTAIEVLSPPNKQGEGREEYLAKRRQTLLSDVHLIEVDLLPGGQRLPMRLRLPLARYFGTLDTE